MNFLTLKEEVQDLLNFDIDQIQQDFTEEQIEKAINRAYKREYRKARQQGNNNHFKAVTTITWPAGQTDYTFVAPLSSTQLIKIEDITNGNLTTEFRLGGSLRWKDKDSLEWLPSGPPSNRNLRVIYYPTPELLVLDTDEPSLIREEFREVLSYSAAIELRMRADEQAPAAWERHLMDVRLDWYKDISYGRPISDGTRVLNPSVT